MTHFKKRGVAMRTFVLMLATLIAVPWVAFASTVDISIVDVDVPVAEVTLAPGESAPITITATVTGKQDGTATFKVDTVWQVVDGELTSDVPCTFTVSPRVAQDPATVFTVSGIVSAGPDEDAGVWVIQAKAYDITNSNATGGKLAAGGGESLRGHDRGGARTCGHHRARAHSAG